MPKSVDSQLQGFKQLSKKLRALGPSVGGKFLRQSVSSAMNPAMRKARAKAPRGTREHRTYKGRLVAPGFLSRNIKKNSFKSRDGRFATASIRVKQEAFYGNRFVEFGTQYQQPQPWLGPAFDESREEMLTNIEKELLKRINRVSK